MLSLTAPPAFCSYWRRAAVQFMMWWREEKWLKKREAAGPVLCPHRNLVTRSGSPRESATRWKSSDDANEAETQLISNQLWLGASSTSRQGSSGRKWLHLSPFGFTPWRATISFSFTPPRPWTQPQDHGTRAQHLRLRSCNQFVASELDLVAAPPPIPLPYPYGLVLFWRKRWRWLD